MITIEKIYLSKDQSRLNLVLNNTNPNETSWGTVSSIFVKNIITGTEKIYNGVSIEDTSKKNNIVGIGVSGTHIISEYAQLMLDDGEAYDILAENGTAENVDLSEGGVYKIYIGTPTYTEYMYFVSPYTFYEYKSRIISAFSDIDNSTKLSRKLNIFSFLENMLNKSIELSLDSDIMMYYAQMDRMATFGYANVNQLKNTYIYDFGYIGY